MSSCLSLYFTGWDTQKGSQSVRSTCEQTQKLSSCRKFECVVHCKLLLYEKNTFELDCAKKICVYVVRGCVYSHANTSCKPKLKAAATLIATNLTVWVLKYSNTFDVSIILQFIQKLRMFCKKSNRAWVPRLITKLAYSVQYVYVWVIYLSYISL